MSRVFLADEIALQRRVVIKVLPPEMAASLSVDRFNLEIKLAAKLQHPHIVPLLSAGEVDGLPYFTMPYVEGESLRARIARAGNAPATDAIRILREVASALDYAHSMGIVHRDIKPDNVLLSHGSAMVTDLGVAKALTASVTRANDGLTMLGTTLGTPAYMAPEQVAADPDIDHRADIYAWGVMAYELLTGATPFAGRTPQAMLAAHVSEAPMSVALRRPGLAPALSTVVMQCLAKVPSERPQSGAALIESLDAVITPQQLTGLPQVAVLAAERPRAQMRRAFFGAGILLALALATFGWTKRSSMLSSHAGSVVPTDRLSIAVLPFVSVGSDSAQDFISDGMTDELAAALTKVPGLQVAARRSAFVFKGSNSDPVAIGSALKVALLLDGSVQRANDRVRVTAQLTRASDGFVLWSERYEGNAREIFALQDSIAAAVVGALKLTLGAGTLSELASTRTKSLEAHDLYLKGRFEASKHTKAGLLASLDLFQKAVAVDPSYPLPWVGMADAYGWLADDYLPSKDAYTKAKAAVTRAIELAPTLAEAHAVLGWILYAYDWDFPAAERESHMAVTLDSSSALARSNYAFALQALGKNSEALVQMRRALALEPLSAAYSANLEWHLLMQRKYREVIAQHAQTVQIDPTYFFSDSWAGVAYRELGQYGDALKTYQQAEAVSGGRPIAGMVATYARLGDTASAKRELARLEEFGRTTHVPADRLALAYTALGDRERAFQLLDKAVNERANGVLILSASPVYDALRSDPRFASLVRRIYQGAGISDGAR